MDRLRVGHFGRRDDRGHVEITRRGWRRTDADGLVGEAHVLRLAVGFGVDDDGANAELAARALDSKRDLATVGDQDLAEQLIRVAGHDGAASGKAR
jgi:hypothetical protein